MSILTRRDALKLGAAALLVTPERAQKGKSVIVAGGGIGGLCCGYELMRRGHEVVVLEASGRTGGHVFTFRDGKATLFRTFWNKQQAFDWVGIEDPDAG